MIDEQNIDKYAKLHEDVLEFAPVNKGSILNYNLDVEQMIADGYKLFVPCEIPEHTNRMYHTECTETVDKIIEELIYDETQEEAEARIEIVRRENFESQFIETSMKDSKGNNAWYRQVPHGYANAPQTVEIADKYVRDAQGMTEQIASLLIFYEKPDFAKAEECTEEWLVQHQFNPPVDMTLQQWLAFEMDFQIRWANLKYKQQRAS